MRKTVASFLEVLETVVIAVAGVVFIRAFVAQPFLVRGSSMEPTFHNQDYLLVDELSYRFRSPARGEVIVFHDPFDERTYYIKRVIGLPGEEVNIADGRVTVSTTGADGTRTTLPLDERYVRPSSISHDGHVTLGPDEYFVVGDNRGFSFDSRSWGPLAASNIVGLVRFRLWPLSQAMAITAPLYD